MNIWIKNKILLILPKITIYNKLIKNLINFKRNREMKKIIVKINKIKNS
jgi:hypothetical protein